MSDRVISVPPRRKPVLGFFLSVLGTAFITALGAAGFSVITIGPTYMGGEVVLIFLGAFVGSFFAITAAGLIIAMPVTWVLASNQLEEAWLYPFIGFLSGATLVLAFIMLTAGSDPAQVFDMLPATQIGAIPGAVFGAFWWFFHRRHAKHG